MNCYLQRTLLPAIDTPVIRYHVEHGYVWEVMLQGQAVAVIHASIICGHGVVVHFDVVPGEYSPGDIRRAMRTGVGYLHRSFPLVLATVPTDRRSLIRTLQRFGFQKISRAGNYVLLQLF